MSVGVFSMDMMQNEFSAIGMRKIWDEKNRIEKILTVEKAIAQAQAEFGIIPEEKNKIIQTSVNMDDLDWRKLRLSYGRSGHFVSGLVKYYEEVLPEDAGSYLHYGATTQDILDTGMILQLKEAHLDIQKRVQQLMKEIARLAEEHQDVVTAGRAHGNHAIPILLGHKIALYLNELMDITTQFSDLPASVFKSAISGSVGNFAGYGKDALAVTNRIAEILELTPSPIGWHTQRSSLVDYMHHLALYAGVMGKLARNLVDLSRSEIGEFSEPYTNGRQGSTAMPTMHNPYLTEAVSNLAQLIHQEMPLMYQSMIVQHEKDTMSWRHQWVAIPNIHLYLSGMFNYLTAALKGGTFNLDAIAHNLKADGGMLMSEPLMNRLAQDIGKKKAHTLMYELGNQARETKRPFEELVREDESIGQYLSASEIDQHLDPVNYTGHSKKIFQQIMQRYQEDIIDGEFFNQYK